jgi:hypothetical protein
VGDLHWPCAAAMLEAGLMNEAGEWLAGEDLIAASKPTASALRAFRNEPFDLRK